MARTVEIVYPVCCGMDVYKSFIVACVAVTDERSHIEHHIKRFLTLFKCDLVRSSFIPPPDIRQLRDLCRYYVKLTNFVSSEKNRAQNCLTSATSSWTMCSPMFSARVQPACSLCWNMATEILHLTDC